MRFTRQKATAIIGILWIILGYGFYLIPDTPGLDDWFDSLRAPIWIIAGMFALISAFFKSISKYALVLMGALVAERVTVYLLLTVLGERSLGWYTATVWIMVYLATLFASSLPDRIE